MLMNSENQEKGGTPPMNTIKAINTIEQTQESKNMDRTFSWWNKWGTLPRVNAVYVIHCKMSKQQKFILEFKFRIELLLYNSDWFILF